MKMKRFFSLLLALCLLTAPLASLAEGVPANPAGGAGTAANASGESAENLLKVEVMYEEAEWDGLLHATVAVSWPSANAQEAENVQIAVELFDGLVMEEGETEISLGNILPGGTKLTQFTLRFDYSVEKPDYVPEPEMILTAWADGIGYTRYTAQMDGTTIPRTMVLGWELTDAGPQAVQADVEMMKDIWSQSYYNRRAFELKSGDGYNEPSFEAAIGQTAGWEEDENDLTYIYINAHGAADNDQPIPAFYANTDNQSEKVGEATYTDNNLVSFERLLSTLNDALEGRVVLITDICYSGQILLAARDLGLDSEKFSILTAAPGNVTSQLWPDRFDLNDLDTTGGKILWVDLPEVDTLFSYGWFTNDLCDLLDAGYAANEHGVVTVGEAYEYMHDAAYAMLRRYETAMNGTNEENLLPTNISGFDDLFDTVDVWKERLFEMFDPLKLNLLLRWDQMEPHEWLKQMFMLMTDRVNPMFAGEGDTLLYCSNSEYDDGKRLLVVLEEKIEYFDPVELYYAYLNEWVVPEIGLARRDDRYTGKASWDWDAAYWAELLYIQGFSGLLSAAVCDLDKNGSLDMITLSVMPREQALIEATNVFYSVNLEMYQIEKGVVVSSDLREDVLYIGEAANGIWSKMKCWLMEFEGQLIFKTHCFSTPGMSGVGDWSHSFGCTFADGKIVDGAPSTYRAGCQVQTESGEIYLTPDYDDDIFEHMGDGIAAIEACYDTMDGAQYNAADATKLYEYIFGYEKPKAYEPLKLLSVPLQASRKDEVTASIKQSVAAAMSEAGKEAYSHTISCNKDTEEFRQSIIYSDEWDYDVVDTENLRAVALAILTAAEVNAPEEVVSAMRDFEFAEKNEIQWSGSSWELRFMMIPDGTYAFVVDCYE